MTLRIALALAAAACAAPALAAPAAPAAAFNRAAWKADYQRIKRGLAQGYANLDWQVDHRRFNLAKADRTIAGMLDGANSDLQAGLIVSLLVDAFDDPHLKLFYGDAPDGPTRVPLESNVDGPSAPATACQGHYENGKAATQLPYASAPGWAPLSDGPFVAGTIGNTGFLRIPAFGEDRYLAACEKVAKPEMDARALQLATRAELNRQLKELIARLRAAGAIRLAIDISGNGGGSEWAEEVAAMFSAGKLSRTEPRRAAPSCDRIAVWKGERPCSIYAGEPKVETIVGTGEWTGPVAILSDHRSASAAEEFVTWLKGNDRAVVAGQRTFGAGCGYVDGGNMIVLTAAPLYIMVPNCSRFTREGINEIEGIAPDVDVDWVGLRPADVPALLDRIFANPAS